MNTTAAYHDANPTWLANPAAAGAVNRILAPMGRVLFALIFIMSGLTHFSAGTIAYAAQAGLPLAALLVPASGVLAVAGGLSVALGWYARLGALALVVFLVPVSFQMHAFWALQDPMMAQIQLAMFMKNVALIGAALLIARTGAGPLSLDERAGR
jgi:putative oxidoreductase